MNTYITSYRIITIFGSATFIIYLYFIYFFLLELKKFDSDSLKPDSGSMKSNRNRHRHSPNQLSLFNSKRKKTNIIKLVHSAQTNDYQLENDQNWLYQYRRWTLTPQT